jgi:hypothetical protein
MRKRTWLIVAAAGVLAASLVSPVAAAPSVNLVIKPMEPIVDESVTATFTVDKSVPAGNSISALLTGTGGCEEIAVKEFKGPLNSGKHLRARFSPAHQVFGSSNEWCQGRAFVKITEATGEKFVRTLAKKYFRFYGRP